MAPPHMHVELLVTGAGANCSSVAKGGVIKLVPEEESSEA